MNRRYIILGLAIVVVIVASLITFTDNETASEENKEKKLKIMTTFYPLEYFAKQIGGEMVDVDTLIPHNTDVHSWQPSTEDIINTDESDVLIYNGGDVDHWFEESILPSINKNNKIIVRTTSGLDEILIDDPHTWIDPVVAKNQAENVYKAIVAKDSKNSAYYENNWNKLKKKFEKLNKNYRDNITNKTKDIIFVTHSAYGYLANRYNFKQIGVIGASADEQPSTQMIANITDMMQNYEIYTIYTDPIFTTDYADTLKKELEAKTDHEINIINLYLILGPIKELDYFEQQYENIENLKVGLYE